MAVKSGGVRVQLDPTLTENGRVRTLVPPQDRRHCRKAYALYRSVTFLMTRVTFERDFSYFVCAADARSVCVLKLY